MIFSSRISKTLVYVLCAALLGSIQVTSSVASGRPRDGTPQKDQEEFCEALRKKSTVRKLEYKETEEDGEEAERKRGEGEKQKEEQEEEQEEEKTKGDKKTSKSNDDGFGTKFLAVLIGGSLVVIVGVFLFFNGKKN